MDKQSGAFCSKSKMIIIEPEKIFTSEPHTWKRSFIVLAAKISFWETLASDKNEKL